MALLRRSVALARKRVPSGDENAIVPLLRRTVWNPGIYEGIPTDSSAGRADGVGGATQHGSTLTPSGSDDRAAIQTALDAAGAAATKTARKFVLLGSGTFLIGTGSFPSPLKIPSYVVLRGTMGSNNARLTKIRNQVDMGNVILMRAGFPDGNWGTMRTVVGTISPGDATVTVTDASGINVGDIIKVDHERDGSGRWGPVGGVSTFQPSGLGDWVWNANASSNHHRVPQDSSDGNPPSVQDFPDTTVSRVISETKEVLAKNGNTLTVYDPSAPVIKGSPFRQWYYKNPQLYKSSSAAFSDVLRYAGVEDLEIEPQSADGRDNIMINQAAFCWAKNVESDGIAQTWQGRHLRIGSQTYRCEVTACYLHESGNGYNVGSGAYGLAFAGDDHYIHNNVIWKHNKCLIAQSCGGGNVVAYNYVDEGIVGPNTGWQELIIGTHAAFCTHVLVEGNYAPNAGADATHGNNGWFTIFRNFLTGRNTSGVQTGPLRMIGFEAYQRDMSSIGNVLGNPADTSWLEKFIAESTVPGDSTKGAIYNLGWNAFDHPSGPAGPVDNAEDSPLTYPTFHRHLDYDSWNNSQYDNPANPVKKLPNSLHRSTAPAYFTAGGYAWPWVIPSGATHSDRVKTLPAKARFDAGQA